ncbi:MAG TPA: AAA family ATPase [Isosphaeraceae bacterium]|nr:AAA family ATPase [Isosphaeraceae bacterium]
MIRVVLVDPVDNSRQDLQRLLGSISSVWLVEVCSSYQAAAKSVAENAPDLTLVTLDSDPEQAIALIQSMSRSNSTGVVLPASRKNDGEMILRAIRAGAREFLTLPAEVAELSRLIEGLVPPLHDAGSTTRRASQVLAITGAAGGIGCTTLAVNLAAALASDPERSVVLADFDLLMGSVETCLDIIPAQTLLEVAQTVDRLDLTLLKRTLTRHSSGLYVLPHPVALEDVAKIDPEALRRVVGLLKAAFNTVVIDTSKSLQSSDIVAFEVADVILLAVELDLACLHNSARLLSLFRQFDGMAEKVRVVINRAGSSVTEISLKKAEETLGLPVSWQVPNAYKSVNLARSRGVTLDAEARGSRVHRAFLEIARELQLPSASSNEPPKPSRGRFAALFF